MPFSDQAWMPIRVVVSMSCCTTSPHPQLLLTRLFSLATHIVIIGAFPIVVETDLHDSDL